MMNFLGGTIANIFHQVISTKYHKMIVQYSEFLELNKLGRGVELGVQ